jgi:hypothetical protein
MPRGAGQVLLASISCVTGGASGDDEKQSAKLAIELAKILALAHPVKFGRPVMPRKAQRSLKPALRGSGDPTPPLRTPPPTTPPRPPPRYYPCRAGEVDDARVHKSSARSPQFKYGHTETGAPDQIMEEPDKSLRPSGIPEKDSENYDLSLASVFVHYSIGSSTSQLANYARRVTSHACKRDVLNTTARAPTNRALADGEPGITQASKPIQTFRPMRTGRAGTFASKTSRLRVGTRSNSGGAPRGRAATR